MAAGDAPDVVIAVRRRGGRGIGPRILSLLYRIVAALARDPVVPDATISRLMSRRFVDALLRFGDADVNLGAVTAAAGFRQATVSVAKGAKGETAYDWRRKRGMAIAFTAGVTDAPLRATARAGTAALVLGAPGAVVAAAIVAVRGNLMLAALAASAVLLTAAIGAGFGVLAAYFAVFAEEVQAATARDRARDVSARASRTLQWNVLRYAGASGPVLNSRSTIDTACSNGPCSCAYAGYPS